MLGGFSNELPHFLRGTTSPVPYRVRRLGLTFNQEVSGSILGALSKEMNTSPKANTSGSFNTLGSCGEPDCELVAM